jgi:hypothetical protein
MAVAVINRLEILFMIEASSFPSFHFTHAYSAALGLACYPRRAALVMVARSPMFSYSACNALRTATSFLARAARKASIRSGV